MALRIPYDSLTLRAVTDELRRALLGGIIQHIAQPVPTDLILSVRHRGANHYLLLSCDANQARAYLTNVRRPNPPSPPTFCMICRKYLEGARITDIRQRGFDRILDMEFEGPDDKSYRLAVELMGKHSNLLLINDEGTILDAAKHITHRVSRHRETLPGRSYVPPPVQEEKADPFLLSADERDAFARSLPNDPEARQARWMGHFAGFSPFLAQEMEARTQQSGIEAAWQALFGAANAGRWEPTIVRNERAETIGAYPFSTVQADASRQHARDSICIALDHYYSTALPRADLEATRRELETGLERAVKARQKQREGIVRSLQEVDRAEEHKQAGELLLANLHQIPPGAESVTVTDYYVPEMPERVLTLDPKKSARDNADAYFRRYRKAKDGAEIQRQQLQKVETDLEDLQAALEQAHTAADIPALRELRSRLQRTGQLRGEAGAETGDVKRTPDFGGKKIRVFTTPEGWDIYVGENSEANDFLTAKVAGPNDLWLHVRANSSAHVVIRTRNDPTSVPTSVLQQAALLAARHSPAKHSSLVPVDYTLKKYVRRPRGSASGAATYQNERTLYVSPKE